jgi:hypothetical protein
LNNIQYICVMAKRFVIPNLREIKSEYPDCTIISRYNGQKMTQGPLEVEIIYKEEPKPEKKKRSK